MFHISRNVFHAIYLFRRCAPCLNLVKHKTGKFSEKCLIFLFSRSLGPSHKTCRLHHHCTHYEVAILIIKLVGSKSQSFRQVRSRWVATQTFRASWWNSGRKFHSSTHAQNLTARRWWKLKKKNFTRIHCNCALTTSSDLDDSPNSLQTKRTFYCDHV